jgi:hypothetical protein
MQKYGAAYVIFSREDVAILPVITRYGMGEPYGDGSSVPEELEQSLFYRSLYGNLHEEGGITRVYPPHSSEAPEVVILALS